MIFFRLFFLFSSLFFMLNAQEFYLKQNIVLKDSKGEFLGKLIVGSRVEFIKSEQDLTQVRFVGYQQEGSKVVYEKLGIMMSGLELEDLSLLNQLEKQSDEYGNVWIKVFIDGFIPTYSLQNSLKPIMEEGEALFTERCGSCHALYDEDEFEVNVWPSIIENMSEMAALSEDEKFLIVKFLQNSLTEQ